MKFDYLKTEIASKVSVSKEETIKKITNEKAQLLKSKYNISVDRSDSSNFNIYTYPSSHFDSEILTSLSNLLKTIEDYVGDIKNKVSIPASSTYDAIYSRFFNFVPRLEYLGIKENVGTINFYLIFREDLEIDYEVINPQVWTAIHSLKPVGVVAMGDLNVARTASNGQTVPYSYSLGTRIYVYVKLAYYLNDRNRGVSNVDSKIKAICRTVVNRNYHKVARSLDYQDFVTPTYEIDGISKVDFSYHLSTNPKLDISDIKDFKKNENYNTLENEVLIFDFSSNNYIVTELGS